MGFVHDVKNDFKEELKTELKHEFKKAAREGVDGVADELHETLDDVERKAGMPLWKIAAGVAAGVVLIGAAVLLARRRSAAPAGLLQRGVREGARYAVLVPVAMRKTRDAAEELSREAMERLDKLPRLQVKFK